MVGVSLVPVSAWAVAPGTTPVITAPADASTATDPGLVVTADSSAPQVRFVLYGQAGNPDYDRTVAVSGATASTSFSLLGLGGTASVDAYDCDEAGVCNTDKDTVTVSVDLDDPVITSPDDNDVVQKSVVVKVSAPGPAIQFFIGGNAVGKDTEAPFQKEISLGSLNDGSKTITIRQCNPDGTICDGEQDSVTVLKDTKGPRWSDLSTSNKTVFPVNDSYKDSTVLSARVAETSLATKVEIRKAGGPLIRTISLGRVDAGKVRATWNGRKGNGDLASKGKYLFRFVGTDRNGVVGKSSDRAVYVSDKRLVSKTVTRTVSAKGSFLGNASGDCSGVYTLKYRGSRYGWAGGLGYYSRSKCNGSASADLAFAFHRVAAPKAVRYGALRIDTYGGGAFRNAGPGIIALYKNNQNQDVGAIKKTGTRLGWHAGPKVDGSRYVRNGKLWWGFGAIKGNWFDVKEYRLTWRVSVLQ
jgi:hypothetical protein